MQRAATYVRDPIAKDDRILSKEDQETACRDYCLNRRLTVSAVFADEAGSRDQFARMMDLATSTEAPFDAVVVWKLSRFAVSLEESIEHRDKLRRAGTKLLSATEKGIDD